jgi:acyl-coenzyme A synthetase/AMP-(fatty) acid ligase
MPLSCRVTGRKYEDIVHIMGLCAAGFVPQLFSPIFPDQIVLSLLAKSGAKALVVDNQFAASADSSGVASFPPLSYEELSAPKATGFTLSELPAVRLDDLSVIVHSSGSTSGMPKLIPQSHAWIRAIMELKWPVAEPQGYSTQTVTNTLGSLAHVGSVCCKRCPHIS